MGMMPAWRARIGPSSVSAAFVSVASNGHRHGLRADISLDVALGVLATARAYQNIDFNLNTAFPVVSNVATWLLSRGEWTPNGFEVLHMGGPDETLGQVK